MTVALVDDRLLAAVLRGSTPRTLRRRSLATTGCWYVRLCQAVLRADDRTGSLSGPFAAIPEPQREQAIGAVLELPDHIALPSLRQLGPRIGRIRAAHALNLLAAEAVVAAASLDAEVFLSVASPPLQATLDAEGISWRLLA